MSWKEGQCRGPVIRAFQNSWTQSPLVNFLVDRRDTVASFMIIFQISDFTIEHFQKLLGLRNLVVFLKNRTDLYLKNFVQVTQHIANLLVKFCLFTKSGRR